MQPTAARDTSDSKMGLGLGSEHVGDHEMRKSFCRFTVNLFAQPSRKKRTVFDSMSFLQPLVRHAARQSLRKSPNILCQKISRAHRLPLLPLVATRFYSPAKSSSSSSSSKDSNSSRSANPADESSTTSSPSEQASTPQSDTTKDPFNQDIQATPGSILSQYTVTEQPSSLETTESASGQRTKPEEYISSADRKRDRMAKIFSWGFLVGLVGTGVYLGRPLEDEERSRTGWGDVCSPHETR